MADYSGGNVTAHIGADISDYQSAMRCVASSTQNAMQSSNKALSTVGKTLMGTGAAITAVGVKSLKGFGDFQASLNQAAVIAGGTSKDIKGLADVANKMGADLPLSAKDAADAMVAMARDGASISTIKAEFPAIAQAATAAGADLQTTASVVQQSMNIWGESIKSPQRAAAVLTQTANLSNASIEDMQQALATIGGTANNAGIDMQTTATAIGLLTNRGFSAAQASQDLNHALLLMQAPSKKGREMMHSLGLSMTDLDGNMKPLPQILNDIADATDGMTSSDKAAALKTMFGTAGMAAILPLMKSIKDETGSATTSWSAFTKEMDKASSSTATATKFLQNQADEMQKNLGSKIEQVGGNWEALTNKAMAGSAGVTGSMLDMTNGTLQWAGSSNSSIAQVARQFLGLAPVIGPAVTSVGAFITSAGKIGGLVKGIGTSITGVGKGIVGFVAKLFGIASGNTAVATTSTAASAGTKAVGNSAAQSAKSMLAMGLAVLEIGAGIGLATAGMALLVLSITKLAKSGSAGTDALLAMTMAIAAIVGVMAVFSPMLTAGAVGLVAFGAAMMGIGVGIGIATLGISALVTALAAANTSFSQIVTTMTAVGVGFAMMITGFVTTLAGQMPIVSQSLLNMLVQFLAQLVTYTPILTNQFLAIIIGFLTTITANIPTIAASITNMLVAMMNAVAANAPTLIAAFTNMVISILGSLTNSLPQFIAAGAAFLISLLNGIAGQMGGIIAAGVNVVVQFINGLANNLGRIIDAGINLIAKFLIGIGNAIPRLVDIAMQTVMKFVYGVGYALGSVAGSGRQLLSVFISGIMAGFGRAHSSGSGASNAVKRGIQSISLFRAGAAIMEGFLGGLKSMWGSITSFVGGIADWIKAHKGPISYDRKLLIPAGKAIMDGFGSSLNANFATVKQSVSSYARQISDEFGKQEYIANAKLTTSSTGVAGQINGGLSALSEKVAEQQTQVPIFQVFNEIIGDKITTTVNTKNARRQATVQLMSGGV